MIFHREYREIQAAFTAARLAGQLPVMLFFQIGDSGVDLSAEGLVSFNGVGHRQMIIGYSPIKGLFDDKPGHLAVGGASEAGGIPWTAPQFHIVPCKACSALRAVCLNLSISTVAGVARSVLPWAGFIAVDSLWPSNWNHSVGDTLDKPTQAAWRYFQCGFRL